MPLLYLITSMLHLDGGEGAPRLCAHVCELHEKKNTSCVSLTGCSGNAGGNKKTSDDQKSANGKLSEVPRLAATTGVMQVAFERMLPESESG